MAKKITKPAAAEKAAGSKAGETPANETMKVNTSSEETTEEEETPKVKTKRVKEKPLSDSEREELEALRSENKKLKPVDAPSFSVEDDEENEIVGGEYEAAVPTFTHDDGSVIDTNELIKGANSKDKKTAKKAAVILSNLVAIKSGIIRRKED